MSYQFRSDSGSDVIIEEETITTFSTDDTLPVSVTASALPSMELAQVMDVDQTPGSPVSPNEDDLLTGGVDAGVEGKMATLMVSTPEGQDGNN